MQKRCSALSSFLLLWGSTIAIALVVGLLTSVPFPDSKNESKTIYEDFWKIPANEHILLSWEGGGELNGNQAAGAIFNSYSEYMGGGGSCDQRME